MEINRFKRAHLHKDCLSIEYKKYFLPLIYQVQTESS